ncbi:bifunctional folylpolyglutamate synthase/dihydrofolate synthase [Methylovirgula sp. 4M-Z18]|uniref:bifunctional folylpolyglutamate synthase/dihydrofolate synthase n=1 Tax=Methylovirgula sp. 4M-Z18 TaxID=2293567 RepID=UPI000E2F8F58|nr:folylpolyglutamate synthase/dihydrofolate synthase family protein [Methylovirgula sp. 4M-Z18]RFB79017.1 bifunctional folylpolyglutamate synthase/dihydrofolate synthase [Methylovirgula sp. 4M-Z18]
MTHRDTVLDRFLPLHPKRIDLSLDRVTRLLARLGSPELHLPPLIHVTGTNGKGSTIAFMRAMLEAAGKSVHVYTSPHLVRFHERIRLGENGGGKLVDDARLLHAFERCEAANEGAPISLFEITTAAALLLFSEAPADYLLLEVGLGGTLDATNVIAKPLASVITPISLDHADYLGGTVEQIAAQKAGIIKRGRPVIIGRQGPEAGAVLEQVAETLRAPAHIWAQDFMARAENGRLVYEDERGLLDLPLPRLAGRHQHINAATAIAALRASVPEVEPKHIEAGLLRVEWPARLQRLARGALIGLAPDGAEIWLDGGHNEDGARVLSEAMADLEDRHARLLVMICGMLTTKDAAAFLGHFRGLVRDVLAVPVEGQEAGRPAAEVAASARAVGLTARAFSSLAAALQDLRAQTWPTPPRILIAGSLYLAGEVLAANGTLPQ